MMQSLQDRPASRQKLASITKTEKINIIS